MPLAVLKAYLAQIGPLHGEEQLAAAQVAQVPHLKKNDRRRVLRGWRRLLPRPRPRKAGAGDLEALGIAVQQEGGER